MQLPRARRVATLATAALLLAATSCTFGDDGGETAAATPEPADETANEAPPPVGLRVGVVLPDAGSVDVSVLGQMAADVRRLDATRGPEIAEVRPYQPTGPEFAADLAWTLAERETDLVCVLGRGTRMLVTELAELHPHLSFCAAPLPANAEVPDTVRVFEIRSEELGHVVGLAAAAVAGDGVIGVVLGSDTKPRSPFRDGITAATGGDRVVQATVDDELDAASAMQQVLDEGAEVVVLDGVPDASEAVEVAAGRALLLLPDVLVRGAAVDQTVLTWRLHWDVLLRDAMDQLVEGHASGPRSYGFPEGVFSVSLGEAAPSSLQARLDRAVEELEERERDPLDPPTEPPNGNGAPVPRPPPEDDESDGDDPDGDVDGGPDGDPDDPEDTADGGTGEPAPADVADPD